MTNCPGSTLIKKPLTYFVIITNNGGAQIIESTKVVSGSSLLLMFSPSGRRQEFDRRDVLALTEVKNRREGEAHLRHLGF